MDTNTYYNIYNQYYCICIFHLHQKSLMPFSGQKIQSEMVCHTTAMHSHGLSLKFIKITSQHNDIAWSIPITKQIFKHFPILFSSLLPMGWIPFFQQTPNSSQPHIFHVHYKPICSFHCLHHGPPKKRVPMVDGRNVPRPCSEFDRIYPVKCHYIPIRHRCKDPTLVLWQE